MTIAITDFIRRDEVQSNGNLLMADFSVDVSGFFTLQGLILMKWAADDVVTVFMPGSRARGLDIGLRFDDRAYRHGLTALALVEYRAARMIDMKPLSGPRPHGLVRWGTALDPERATDVPASAAVRNAGV